MQLECCFRDFFGESSFHSQFEPQQGHSWEGSVVYLSDLRLNFSVTAMNWSVWPLPYISLKENNHPSCMFKVRETSLLTHLLSGGRKRHPGASKLAKRLPAAKQRRSKKESDKRRKTSLFRKVSNKRVSAEIQQVGTVPEYCRSGHLSWSCAYEDVRSYFSMICLLYNMACELAWHRTTALNPCSLNK